MSEIDPGLPSEFIDRVIERAKQSPRIQKIIADARLFDALKQDEGWQALHERVTKHKSRFMLGLASRLMLGENVSREEILYNKGFYEGAVFTVRHPELAHAVLEQTAKLAWALAIEESEADRADDSPYLIEPTEGGQ